MIDLRLGDCLEVLKTLEDNSVDSIVTDPPYGIGFMNKEWDSPQKHKELIERENKRSQERFEEGKSPVKGGFSKGVQPGLPIGGAKEGRWFQEWCEEWAKECYRVLKPGGHMLSFSAPRTYHRMATAFEDSGFQIRDQIMWVFGSGFPKSHNIGKAIDKIQGNEREVVGISDNTRDRNNHDYNSVGNFGSKEIIETKGQSDWEGWGTALKPAHEPICMARKPLSEKSIAENVLKHGTGGINIDDCRIPFDMTDTNPATNPLYRQENNYKMPEPGQESNGAVSFTSSKNEISQEGRFPANIIFDEEAGKILDKQSGVSKSQKRKPEYNKPTEHTNTYTPKASDYRDDNTYSDTGGASRFFYCPKVSKKERNAGLEDFEEKTDRQKGHGLDRRCGNCGTSMLKPQDCKCENPDWITPPKKNHHPTVKPIKLMEYLITLVTPKGGIVLEPFMGSGSTGIAAKNLGMSFIGIEREEEYFEIAKQRIKG
jgi:site-specific DNA-methyltransferase (adenine-specific)